MNNEEDNKELENWLKLSLNNSRNAFYAIRLGGLMDKHAKLVDDTITKNLPKQKREKVIDWILSNLPVSDDAASDSMILEIAWLVYAVGAYSDRVSDEKAQQETDFLSEIRSRYFAKRKNQLQLGN